MSVTAGRRGRSIGTRVYLAAGKRAFDVVVVVLTLPFIVPLCLVVATVVRCCLGRPVLYRQTRPGLAGQPFQLIKIRTMTEERDPSGEYLPDGMRLLRIGKILRAASLDELPTLLNVLRGDMSLVGPRPLMMEYLSLYDSDQARRHELRPGITGWAQVNGRNVLAWDGRLRLDVWYVDHISFGLDLKILAMTLVKVLRREGIAAEGHATMPKFKGSEKQ